MSIGGSFSITTIVSSALGALNVATPESVIGIGSSLAVAVRRLRDAGRRWTELLWLLAPIAGVVVIVLGLCETSKPEGMGP